MTALRLNKRLRQIGRTWHEQAGHTGEYKDCELSACTEMRLMTEAVGRPSLVTLARDHLDRGVTLCYIHENGGDLPATHVLMTIDRYLGMAISDPEPMNHDHAEPDMLDDWLRS